MEVAVFIVCAAIVLGGALGVVLSRNPVHSALSLVATLFGIAVLFLEQDAQLLTAVQVIVYTGAIVVLILFVIMLLGVDEAENLEEEPLHGQRVLAVVAGFALLASLCVAFVNVWRDGLTGKKSSTRRALEQLRQRHPAGPIDLHHQHLRLRDHRGPAHDRRHRRRRHVASAIELSSPSLRPSR